MLFPKVIEFSIEDHRLIIENIHIFQEIGFDIEDFSDNSISIQMVPVVHENFSVEELISEIVVSLKSDQEREKTYKERIAATVACHAARRAGDILDTREMEILIDKIFKDNIELRCPHGRPFMYTLGKSDLERMFKRQ